MDSILGRRSVNAKPIKDERLRVTLAIFVAKTRLGWTVPNRHHRVRSPIDAQESLERLDAKIARLAPDFKAGETRIRRTIGNTTLPASISRRRPRSAAVWSRRHGSSAIARTNYLRASTASCRAGTPTKPPRLSDFSVCTTWGVRDKKIYLLGILRQRLEFPALKRAVREQQNLYHAHRNPDRGQGLGHPADPGIDRRRLPRGHPIPAKARASHLSCPRP